MTKEPIMIDDVDVVECEHRCDTHKELLADGHIKEFVHYCQITNTGCYGYICHYKQLKRKEKECETWKKELDKTHLLMLERQDELVKEILKNDQLKAEKEKFKEIISQALQDFSIEIGTPQYDRLLEGVKEIGIEGVR